jgi:hypothetical protein
MPGHPFGTHEAWRTLDGDRRQAFCGPGGAFSRSAISSGERRSIAVLDAVKTALLASAL